MLEENIRSEKIRKKHQTPHDAFARGLLVRPWIIQRFLNCYLPTEVLEKINLKTLKLIPRNFIDRHAVSNVSRGNFNWWIRIMLIKSS